MVLTRRIDKVYVSDCGHDAILPERNRSPARWRLLLRLLLVYGRRPSLAEPSFQHALKQQSIDVDTPCREQPTIPDIRRFDDVPHPIRDHLNLLPHN